MNILNFVIPTAGLWILDSAVVTLLARHLSVSAEKNKTGATDNVSNDRPRLSGNIIGTTGMASQPAPETEEAESEPKLGTYISVSVAVLGLAGILAGLAGHPLIGLSTRARSWPGMLAMIAGSFFGAAIGGEA